MNFVSVSVNTSMTPAWVGIPSHETSSRYSPGGACSEGDIGEWLETASHIFSDGIPDIEDYCDPDVIDWEQE
jgi:hypothetical protein